MFPFLALCVIVCHLFQQTTRVFEPRPVGHKVPSATVPPPQLTFEYKTFIQSKKSFVWFKFVLIKSKTSFKSHRVFIEIVVRREIKLRSGTN